MPWALAILLSAADPELTLAETAWSSGKYDLVLPRLEKALAHPLPAAELVRAYALQAHVHVAFDRLDEATLAFRRLLGVDEHWLLEPEASPKLLAVFAEARRKGAIAVPASALVPKPKPVEAVVVPLQPEPVVKPAEPSSKAWVWVVVGVVVVGAAAAGTVYWFERPVVPDGTLGRGDLR